MLLYWENWGLRVMERRAADEKKHPEKKNWCQGKEWGLEVRWRRC